MKTLRNIILVVITTLFISNNIFAYDMCVDGIYYNKTYSTSNEVEVTYFNLINNKIYNHYVGDIIIPDSIIVSHKTYYVVKIKKNAFSNSNSLKSITLPKSIRDIGYGAFVDCDSLKFVIFLNTTPPTTTAEYALMFDHEPILYVPCGCYDMYTKYSGSTEWKKCSSYIRDTMLYLFTINGVSSNTNIGTVEVGDISCSTTITAIPNSHYHFTRWTDGNTDNPRLIEGINNDTAITFTAAFAIDTYKVAIIYDSFFGTVSGAGNYVYNDTVTLVATPTPHNKCKFDKWNDGDTNAKRSFIISQDTTFTANFIIDDTKVTTTDYNNNITVYPNPTNDKLFIESNNIVINKIEVFNVIGKCIYTSNNSNIDLGQYENGMYIIRLTTTEGNIIKRVIKG